MLTCATPTWRSLSSRDTIDIQEPIKTTSFHPIDQNHESDIWDMAVISPHYVSTAAFIGGAHVFIHILSLSLILALVFNDDFLFEKMSSDEESCSASPNVTYLGDEICLTPLHFNPSTPNLSSVTDNSLNLSHSSRTGNSFEFNPNANPFIPDGNSDMSTISGKNELNDIISDKRLPSTILQNLRLKNVEKIIIGHININSIRNKIHILADLIRGRVDILLVSETKLDDSFPRPQFFLQGYSEPIRLDRTANGGGLLLYLRHDIPVKSLPLIAENIECVISEITISKKKWLLLGTYNPSKSLISKHLSTLETSLCRYLSTNDNVLILGDFNSEITEEAKDYFCSIYNLKSFKT